MQTELEFIYESQELIDFVKKLVFISYCDSIDGEDDGTSLAVFHDPDDNKHYVSIVKTDRDIPCIKLFSCTNMKLDFCAWHKEFKRNLPYVVTFTEVTMNTRVVQETYWTHNDEELCVQT